VCFALGLGRIHERAPWGLAHDYLPLFESQHVPPRWLYPGALLLVVAAAAIVERILVRQRWRGALEVALLSLGMYVALDIGLEAQKPLVSTFTRHLAPSEDSLAPFHQEWSASASMRYDASDWAPPNMPSMRANVGVLDCNTFPGFNSYYRDKQNHTPGLGAVARDDTAYHGEAFVTGNGGTAHIDEWTPNAVVVSVHGAHVGDLVVLNQNWDPGWRANGSAALDYRSTIATPVGSSDEVVTFRFIPRFFFVGCLLLLSAVLGLVWVSRARRAML
jgi:hypothetical protein